MNRRRQFSRAGCPCHIHAMPRKTNAGMTLVELLIATVISLIAVTMTISMFVAASKMGVESFLRNKAAMEARIVIDTLTTDVRGAVGVPDSCPGFTAGPTTLILRVPSIDSNGIPTDMDLDDGTSETDYIIYHQADNPNDLIRTVVLHAESERDGAEKVVGTSTRPAVTTQGTYSVLPDALGAYVIHYQFNSVQSRAGKDYSKPVAGSVRLRNKGSI